MFVSLFNSIQFNSECQRFVLGNYYRGAVKMNTVKIFFFFFYLNADKTNVPYCEINKIELRHGIYV
jgi:hypothetical protein